MPKKLTKKQIEKMAYEIRKFLLDNEMWIDVTIYFNGKALSTSNGREFGYNDPEKVFLREDVDPRDYFEYVGDILSMSFEGPFCHCLAYGTAPSVEKAFRELLAKYGVYYELGQCWNLSLYTI